MIDLERLAKLHEEATTRGHAPTCLWRENKRMACSCSQASREYALMEALRNALPELLRLAKIGQAHEAARGGKE